MIVVPLEEFREPGPDVGDRRKAARSGSGPALVSVDNFGTVAGAMFDSSPGLTAPDLSQCDSMGSCGSGTTLVAVLAMRVVSVTAVGATHG